MCSSRVGQGRISRRWKAQVWHTGSPVSSQTVIARRRRSPQSTQALPDSGSRLSRTRSPQGPQSPGSSTSA
jgi:hypothetical protein